MDSQRTNIILIMTEQEQLSIAGSLLVFAFATEELMRSVLKIEKQPFSHETKQLWNGMLRSVQSAQYYYGKFTDLIASAIYESDGDDMTRQDIMRREAMEMIRMKLAVENANHNGYPATEVEKAVRRLSEGEGKRKIISDEVIDKFKIK